MSETARPTPISERVLAPDLARGFMLLLIALANSVWYLWAMEPGAILMHPAQGSIVDKIVQGIMITAVDARAYPMFAFLFAYGIGQLYANRTAVGVSEKQTRRLLRTRHLWMILFGGVHAFLLWQGDIVGVYGVVGLIMVPLFFNRSDKTLKVWIVVLLAFGAVASVLGLISGAYAPPEASPATSVMAGMRGGITDPNYLSSAITRLISWLISVPFLGLLTLAIPTAFLAGILAARHRLLDDPGRHLPLLRRIAVIGIAVGWIGGAATALDHTGVTGMPHGWAYGALQFYTGVYAGIGYAALFGLIAYWIVSRGRQHRGPTVAFAALGRRSLSGYLAQSVILAPLLSAWGFGLGAVLSSWSMALLAVAVWLLTLLGAYLLDRAGRRGPAETLLRSLVYRGSRTRRAPKVAPQRSLG